MNMKRGTEVELCRHGKRGGHRSTFGKIIATRKGYRVQVEVTIEGKVYTFWARKHPPIRYGKKDGTMGGNGSVYGTPQFRGYVSDGWFGTVLVVNKKYYERLDFGIGREGTHFMNTYDSTCVKNKRSRRLDMYKKYKLYHPPKVGNNPYYPRLSKRGHRV